MGKVLNMFFIKAAFWLSLVVAFIPVDPAYLAPDQRNVTPMETVGVAQSLVKDLSGFCQRNSQACETGGVIISQMGLKAREGARIVYTYLDDNAVSDFAKNASLQKDNVQVGSIAK